MRIKNLYRQQLPKYLKKNLTIILFCFSLGSYAQEKDGLSQTLEYYFKHLPYEKKFGNWLSLIEKDSTFYIDTNSPEISVDSFTILIKGSFRNFQPFSLSSPKCYFSITTTKLSKPDKSLDTILFFNVTTYLDTTALSKKFINREYKRINKEFRNLYSNKIEKTLKSSKGRRYPITSYYEKYATYPSLIIALGNFYGLYNYGIRLTLRMRLTNALTGSS